MHNIMGNKYSNIRFFDKKKKIYNYLLFWPWDDLIDSFHSSIAYLGYSVLLLLFFKSLLGLPALWVKSYRPKTSGSTKFIG